MRILVTGGSGYVGSCAAHMLSAAGHQVLIYDNLSTGARQLSAGFEFVEGDIADGERLSPCLARVDAVMHFAASAYVGESVLQPRQYFRNNVERALAMMDCILASTVRMLVFSSSCAVYGVPHTLPITETSPKEPINPYGATKLFFERVLSAYAVSDGLRSVALRYFNAAGAHPNGTIGEIHEPETHLIPLAIQAALGTGPPLTVFGENHPTVDGTCVRDYVHVVDLGDAHVRAVEYLAAGGESTQMNLGTGRGSSIREVLAMVESVSGRPVPHQFASGRAGDPPALYAEAQMAKQTLGWEARNGLRQIVESALKWEMSRRQRS